MAAGRRTPTRSARPTGSASPGDVPRRGRRAAAAARRQELASAAATRGRRASAATRPSRATAATASRCSGTSTAQGSGTSCPRCWRDKPTGTTDVFGRLWWDRPALHDPHRVLQAREGPLPPPDRAPADHDPRGGPLHELPRRLRLARGSGDDRVARQIGNAVPPLLARRIAESLSEALDSSN